MQSNSVPVTSIQKQQQNNNNNNKGENEIGSNGVGSRRGKSNSESKAQAVRNKQKNSQNKEKSSSTTRTTSRSESSSTITSQPQINGQKEIRNDEVVQKSNGRYKIEQQKGTKLLVQQIQELKINGVVQTREHSQSESEPETQREGSTPASTISSSEDSNANHQTESGEENATVLGELFFFKKKNTVLFKTFKISNRF